MIRMTLFLSPSHSDCRLQSFKQELTPVALHQKMKRNMSLDILAMKAAQEVGKSKANCSSNEMVVAPVQPAPSSHSVMKRGFAQQPEAPFLSSQSSEKMDWTNESKTDTSEDKNRREFCSDLMKKVSVHSSAVFSFCTSDKQGSVQRPGSLNDESDLVQARPEAPSEQRLQRLWVRKICFDC
jgi:hypothetical protein